VLNNLAFASWMHVLDLPKLKEEGTDPDGEARDQILKDEGYTMAYMLQSMELREKAESTATNHTLLEALVNLELNADGKDALSPEKEADFHGLLESPNVGKTITNLSEYLLLTQGMKGDIDNAAFWFKLGLKYYERVKPDNIDRHLIMLALFYATRDKRMIAEGLYRQVLDRLEYDTSSASINYNLVMALNFYGRMLLANPKRESEAKEYLKQSETLGRSLPHWYDKLDNIYMPGFDLD